MSEPSRIQKVEKGVKGCRIKLEVWGGIRTGREKALHFQRTWEVMLGGSLCSVVRRMMLQSQPASVLRAEPTGWRCGGKEDLPESLLLKTTLIGVGFQ